MSGEYASTESADSNAQSVDIETSVSDDGDGVSYIQNPVGKHSKVLRILHECGLLTLLKSPYDIKVLLIQHILRNFAFGISTLLTLFLSALGAHDNIIGIFMTATLIGDLAFSFGMSLVADGLGRRTVLMIACGIMSISGLAFVLADNIYVLLFSAIIGIISPSGKEVGPFRAIEEAIVAHCTTSTLRTDIYAWYALLGRVGMALGTMFCGTLVDNLHQRGGWSRVSAYKMAYVAYTVTALFMLVVSYYLSDECEVDRALKRNHTGDSISSLVEHRDESRELLEDSGSVEESRTISRTKTGLRDYLPKLSAYSRKLLLVLLPLFCLDSFGAGLSGNGWLSFYFSQTFTVHEGALGRMLFVADMMAVGASLAAASISKRIGVVRTMLLANISSTISLGFIPVIKNLQLAVLLFIFRAGSHEMDQAPRQALISSVMPKDERTSILAIIGVVRTLSISVGPMMTGIFAEQGRMWISFELAMIVKLLYDVGIAIHFCHINPDDRASVGEA
ncbi:major facilitator superfamily domain-containing protein [Lipomyces orientalis]|uniref:Major facilitator superfamily domain-containing protein n=1 Tax=Lipomyces orientalis TaxID=1233043 RepID=A0ACC3TCU8_9ASCO